MCIERYSLFVILLTYTFLYISIFHKRRTVNEKYMYPVTYCIIMEVKEDRRGEGKGIRSEGEIRKMVKICTHRIEYYVMSECVDAAKYLISVRIGLNWALGEEESGYIKEIGDLFEKEGREQE